MTKNQQRYLQKNRGDRSGDGPARRIPWRRRGGEAEFSSEDPHYRRPLSPHEFVDRHILHQSTRAYRPTKDPALVVPSDAADDECPLAGGRHIDQAPLTSSSSPTANNDRLRWWWDCHTRALGWTWLALLLLSLTLCNGREFFHRTWLLKDELSNTDLINLIDSGVNPLTVRIQLWLDFFGTLLSRALFILHH